MMWLVLPHWSIKGVLLRGDWLGLKGNLSQSPFSCRRIWSPLSNALFLFLTFEPSRHTCAHHDAWWIVSWRHKRTTSLSVDGYHYSGCCWTKEAFAAHGWGVWLAYRCSDAWRNYLRSSDTPCRTDEKDQIGCNEAFAFWSQMYWGSVKNCKRNDTNQVFT